MNAESPGGPVEGRFQIVGEIGSGQYSTVYKALDSVSGDVVALKKVRMFDSRVGLPLSFYNEVKALEDLRHENIIGYRGTTYCERDHSLCLVLEFCDRDLGSLIRQSRVPVAHAKSFMKQILEGVCEMHRRGWMHLDLKPENIVVTLRNEVKICDFGLTRRRSNGRSVMVNAVTLAYRAPEVLLQDANYDQAVDMWSLGCVFYEIATGKRLFGSAAAWTDLGFLEMIFKVCGTPTLEEWPNLKNLPLFEEVMKWRPHLWRSKLGARLRKELPDGFEGLADVIMSMLVYDPQKRMTAEQALQHPFFADADRASSLPMLGVRNANGRCDARARGDLTGSIGTNRTFMLRKERILPPPICVY